MENNKNFKKENRQLYISFIFRKNKKFILRKKGESKKFIQNKPYNFGLCIKNIGDKSSPELDIKQLVIKSVEGGTVRYTAEEEPRLPKMNPGESAEIWWPHPIKILLRGHAWVQCDLDLLEKNFEVTTFQDNCGHYEKYKDINQWGEDFFIFSILEISQKNANFWMIAFTVIITILTGIMIFK